MKKLALVAIFVFLIVVLRSFASGGTPTSSPPSSDEASDGDSPQLSSADRTVDVPVIGTISINVVECAILCIEPEGGYVS